MRAMGKRIQGKVSLSAGEDQGMMKGMRKTRRAVVGTLHLVPTLLLLSMFVQD
jgi:hypothetical protein